MVLRKMRERWLKGKGRRGSLMARYFEWRMRESDLTEEDGMMEETSKDGGLHWWRGNQWHDREEEDG